ncbi:MAG: TonB-dependent receptor [Robiginitomaculum sp.]|nr:MAG: TonB-dependent receptor [Robiginitomaculum sp.]
MRSKVAAALAFFGLMVSNPALLRADDIIVTATRQALPSREYAGSVTVLTLEQLQSTAAVHPAELLNEVAGVNIHRGSGQEHLTAIRSPVLTGGAGAGSFLVLEDGVPLRAAGFSNVNGLFESALELAGGVEITKGPGSVLYGSNAVHGLINILSQEPASTSQPELDILGNEIGFGRLKASFGGEAFAGQFRVSASFAHDPGFRVNSGFDQQKIQIRHDAEFGGWAAKTLFTFQNLNQETAGFIQGVDAYKDLTLVHSNPNPEAFRDGKSARLAVHVSKAIGANAKLSLIPYARWVDLSFRRHFVPGKALEDSGHQSIGLLASYQGSTENFGYTIGLDSEYTSGFLHEFQPGPGVFSFIQGEHFNYEVKAIVLAPYAQVRLALGPQTQLKFGARAEYTRYDYHNKLNTGQFGRFIRIADRKDDFFTLSPKIGLTHALTRNLSLYGRLARGARAPQVTDAYSLQSNQVPGDIKTETLDSAEIGLKGKLGEIQLELALFAMHKNNFFFRNANGFNVINGKTNHQGLEASFSLPLAEHLELSGGFTWANHTYAFTELVGSASSSIRDGDQVDSAPRTLGFAQLNLAPNARSQLSLKWQHVGHYFTDPGNTAIYPGHDVFTLRANYQLTPRINLYGRFDNLFDSRFADRADFAFGNHRFFPGRPRTLFFGIRFRG